MLNTIFPRWTGIHILLEGIRAINTNQSILDGGQDNIQLRQLR